MTNQYLFPAEWCHSKLDDLFSHVIGGDWGKDSDFDDPDFIEARCIRGTEFKNWDKEKGLTAVRRKVKKSSIKTRKLMTGDILVEISGGGPDQPVGRTVLIDNRVISQHNGKDIVCTNFLRLARPVTNICPYYLNGFLRNFYLSGEIIKYQGGSNNLRNLKFKEYSTINIPLPPLAEQKEIATLLDNLLAQVDTLKTRLDAIPNILKRFRQSVLAAAVSGKLTAEWREKNILEAIDIKKINQLHQKALENKKKIYVKPKPFANDTDVPMLPDSWAWFRSEELCDLITKGTTPSKDAMFSFGDIPYIKVYNLTFDGSLDFSIEPTFISQSVHEKELSRSKVYPGDVLMNIVGPPLG